MKDEPRKSFGFLDRVAAFDPNPKRTGPIFGVLPVRPTPPQPQDATGLGRPPAQKALSPLGEGMDDPEKRAFLERLEARKQRQASKEAWLRKKYAQFNPWKGENA